MVSNWSTSSFTCLSDSISTTHITNETFWMLRQELHQGTPAIAAVVTLFFVVSFLWNLFILISFVVKNHLLQEPGNMLLFNLALVDFLVTISNMLLTIISAGAREFIFGRDDVTCCRLCSTFGFLLISLIAVSLHTLAALSLDRFVLLAWPLHYKRVVTRPRVTLLLCVIWILGFLIALPPILGFGQEEFNTNFGACLPRFVPDHAHSPYNFYYVLFVAVEAMFPLGVLGVTNIWTYKIVSGLLRRNFRRRKTFHLGVPQEEKREGLRHHQQQQQLVKVFGALLMAHLVSWTPVMVVVFVIIRVDADKIPPQVFIFGWVCYLTNPVANPIIETFFVKDLRYQVGRVKRRVGKSLREAGSVLYHRASQGALVLGGALEEANRKMDREEEEEEGRRKKKKEEEAWLDCRPSSSSGPTDGQVGMRKGSGEECVLPPPPPPPPPAYVGVGAEDGQCVHLAKGGAAKVIGSPEGPHHMEGSVAKMIGSPGGPHHMEGSVAKVIGSPEGPHHMEGSVAKVIGSPGGPHHMAGSVAKVIRSPEGLHHMEGSAIEVVESPSGLHHVVHLKDSTPDVGSPDVGSSEAGGTVVVETSILENSSCVLVTGQSAKCST